MTCSTKLEADRNTETRNTNFVFPYLEKVLELKP